MSELTGEPMNGGVALSWPPIDGASGYVVTATRCGETLTYTLGYDETDVILAGLDNCDEVPCDDEGTGGP